MANWLLKTEPGSYSWADLVRDGATEWDGVRNAAAAGHLREMKKGDRVLLYHSGAAKTVVGQARVARVARPDGDDGRWASVRVEPVAPLPCPVTLATMKATPALAGMAVLRQGRLSVSPVDDGEWDAIMDLAG